MAFFAPLAGRLGIWQLKWALEDLAFRHLYPAEYQDIADNLDGRREARERQVEAIRQDLAFRLTAAGISDAVVQGRAKHIYSIWNKMSYKAVGFKDVYDVQAVRVLVADIDTCYRVLGIVHRSWPPISREFDDYIANPKANGYRSIHTAVIGPAGKTLEVQIRTRTMHEESELGMCAHWAYKDETNGTGDGPPADAGGSQKIDWLRSLLEWQEEQREVASAVAGVASAAPVFRGQDRVFVTTPQGHVLDLAPGATPVDFAYRIHTEIGHRCRGARIDGRQVPLNTRLNTGECVEIETGDSATPQREWLNPLLGYVTTARARSKIQSWFRDQSAASNIEAGQALLEAAVGAGTVEPMQSLGGNARHLARIPPAEISVSSQMGEDRRRDRRIRTPGTPRNLSNVGDRPRIRETKRRKTPCRSCTPRPLPPGNRSSRAPPGGTPPRRSAFACRARSAITGSASGGGICPGLMQFAVTPYSPSSMAR